MARKRPTSEFVQGVRAQATEEQEERDRSKKRGHALEGTDLDGVADPTVLLAPVIDECLKHFLEKAASDTGNNIAPSVPDLIRLMQLRRELKSEEQPAAIEVRWIQSRKESFLES